LASLARDGAYVPEAPSFQLDLIPSLSFDIAILLNITPDHLDRQGSMDEYIAAKRRIFAGQKPGGAAIIGIDDEICRDICGELRRGQPARIIPISVWEAATGGVYVESGWLVDAMNGPATRVLELASAERLPGSHNWQNAAAVYAAARSAGIAAEAATAAICSFPGLAHRQELVDTIDGVRYIN